MRKVYFITGFIFFSGLIVEAGAQQLPATINVTGGSAVINNQIYDFSIGEMVLVQTFTLPGLQLTQGFLQPFLMNSNTTEVFIVNNIITPNGDGKNDFFVVNGLEKYPGNKLTIFDRAGRRLFFTANYQSDWDGYINGSPLAEDTYYYRLDLNATESIKGFISILYKR